jgi:hypothetical protein
MWWCPVLLEDIYQLSVAQHVSLACQGTQHLSVLSWKKNGLITPALVNRATHSILGFPVHISSHHGDSEIPGCDRYEG